MHNFTDVIIAFNKMIEFFLRLWKKEILIMITNCRPHSPRAGIRRPSDLPEPNHRLPRPLAPPLRISLTARRSTPSTIHSAPPPLLLTWDPRPRLPAPLSQFSAPSLPFRFRPQIRILHLLLHTPTTRPTATFLSLLVRLFSFSIYECVLT